MFAPCHHLFNAGSLPGAEARNDMSRNDMSATGRAHSSPTLQGLVTSTRPNSCSLRGSVDPLLGWIPNTPWNHEFEKERNRGC